MRLTGERSTTSWPGRAIGSGIVLLTLTAVACAAGCGAQPRPSRGVNASASPVPPTSSAAPAPAAAEQNPLTQPLSQAGPGWAIAEFTTGSSTVAGPVTLDLVAPSGQTYSLHSWAATTQPPILLDWSGDRSRVLLAESSSCCTFSQLTLATGQVTTFTLPAGSALLGYTRPDGENILVAGNDGIVRYNLAGTLKVPLVSGSQYRSAISSPDGLTEVVNGSSGLELASNSGGIIRQLPVPGVHGCDPVRWWNATTMLADCTSSGPRYAQQVWLVPVTGASTTALTPVRNYHDGPDVGDLDAWQLPAGLYVQALGACGTVFIGQQRASGSVTQVNVPGGNANNLVAATWGSQMLVLEKSACRPGGSLVWLNPATAAAHNVLLIPAHGYGVMAVVPFNGGGTQPLATRA